MRSPSMLTNFRSSRMRPFASARVANRFAAAESLRAGKSSLRMTRLAAQRADEDYMVRRCGALRS
jgi:hypothetical protein